MGRTLAFIASGVLTLLDGALGIYATIWPPTDDASKANFLDALVAVTLLAIAALVAFVIFENKERKTDKTDREKHNRMLAELHADKFQKTATVSLNASAVIATPQPDNITGEGHGTQPPQTGTATGTVRNIADEVKAGNPLARFEWENVTSLRAAGLRLAKLYRDFADKPVDREEIKTGNYLSNFWAEFPFGELAALKDRMTNILGFEVASAAEELPSEPDRIKKLAKHLQNEALKIADDVPL
jgi:hypothetical protein